MNINPQRKLELAFLLLSSMIIAFVSNLQYYSLFFYSVNDYQIPYKSICETTSKVSWYTSQVLFSILILSLFNYYWRRYILLRKPALILNGLLTIIYNILITIALFKTSMYIAGLTVGYPFSEEWAFNYYLWKYIYLTPSSIIVASVLNLIVRKRQVEINNAKLIEENLSNQLKTLKDQIKPHFLFNTLNTLSAVIRNEPRDEGLKFVDDLAGVYRYILEESNNDLVDLSTELVFANSYIRLLKKRFHNKFNCEILVPEKYLSFQIPPLTLQLLIENAIKHNEFPEASPLKIKIDIDKNNIRIQNNLQPKTNDSSGLGIGLQNLSKRYNILTDKDIIINKDQNSFIVRLPLIKNAKINNT